MKRPTSNALALAADLLQSMDCPHESPQEAAERETAVQWLWEQQKIAACDEWLSSPEGKEKISQIAARLQRPQSEMRRVLRGKLLAKT